MSARIVQIISLARERLGEVKKLGELRSVITRGFYSGVGRRELFNELRKSGMTEIKANDFFRYSRGVYEHLEKASQVRGLGDDEYFKISELPQENRGLGGRFWARVRLDLSYGKEGRETIYRTYVFDERQTIGELKNRIGDIFGEYVSRAERHIEDISIEELYKQW